MMLLLVLVTLMVLAIAINISEKIFYPHRNTKITNKSSYVKPTYSHKHSNQNYKSFLDDQFLLGNFIGHLKNKQKEKEIQLGSKQEDKNRNNIIHWPKN